MRVFVAGASGAIGTRLVPQLIDRGHEVIGTFRSPGNADRDQAAEGESVASSRRSVAGPTWGTEASAAA